MQKSGMIQTLLLREELKEIISLGMDLGEIYHVSYLFQSDL